ncbi:stage III sporulation protein AF [Paenibacillus sp. FJAT-26967]|uniref:stage III sporulation protein AF n=1 Tax=Paenibacillus sp. FJAT-26967 TaxID=1729690 RepID=UPI000838F83D|nr:stage III sporulation protein AF [Paenibacillus sp. FJAT-26967]
MDWLSGWLKTIVALILLATFIELMLPTSKMQRYVRTAMSLFILLTLLSPVLEITRKGWDPGKLLAAAQLEQNQQGIQAVGASGSSGLKSGLPAAEPASLEAVLQQSDRLKAENQRQAQRLLEEDLAAGMKQELQQQTVYPIRELRVTTELGGKVNPSVTRVQILLDEPDSPAGSPSRSSGGSGSAAADAGGSGAGSTGAGDLPQNGPIAEMEPVAPVARVEISTEPIGGAASLPAAPVEASAAAGRLTAAQQEAAARLVTAVQLGWQVDPTHISVQWTKERMKL